MAGPTSDFWQERFEKKQTGWDRGAPSPQLLAWLESGALQPCRIAVPGCGSGWEVAELARRGFEVVGIDYTPAAVERTRALLSAQGLSAEVMQDDVLTYQPDKPFDAIYEQTCMCALHPDHWVDYARQLHQWLAPPGAACGRCSCRWFERKRPRRGSFRDRLITATSTPCGRSFPRKSGRGPSRPMKKCPIRTLATSSAFA